MPANPRALDAWPVAVVGGGLVGMTAVLALAKLGVRTAWVVRDGPPPADLRTAALFPASVQLLDNLGVWRDCTSAAAPLTAIRLIDDTSWPLKAPETLFRAAERGLPALAWNIGNGHLGGALDGALRAQAPVRRFATAKTPDYRQMRDAVAITLAEGEGLSARLVIAADGRSSPLRAFAGIAAKTTAYDQSALVCSFSHGRPHLGVSTELHRDAGPLTTVPMPATDSGDRSGLVWVERQAEAARLLALDMAPFRALLQDRLHGLLGRIGDIGPRMSFELQSLVVDRFACRRVALIGEAGHVLPPIGAQGLNIGLRDVAELIEVIGPHLAAGRDHGAAEVLDIYDRRRRVDLAGRGRGVDLLNRSLTSGLLPLQLARGAGLHAINSIAPLRQLVMRAGSEGLGPLPPLMRAPAAAAAGPS